VGARKTWVAAAGVFAISLGLFAGGSSAAKTRTAPVNTAPPSISGTPSVGATLTGNAGGWSGSGVRYTYQWLRCDSTGGTCAPVSGATAVSYGVTAAEVGSTLRFSVIASSRSGSTSGTSAATAVVTESSTGAAASPSAPSGLKVAGATGTSVTLSWTASTGADPAAGYDVYVNQTSLPTTTGTSATIGSLACGKSYTFAVDAYDSAGNKSDQVSTTASTGACASGSDSRIYWGAWIEGKQTYSYLYGGTWANAPWSSQTWTKYTQNVGKAPSIIHWGAGTFWDHPFSNWTGTLNLVQNAGALNLIDMDTGSVSLASIANGSEDSAITTWAQQAKAYGHPFFLRLNWEMNGGWFPWGTTTSTQNTPADYVAAWRHIHDIFAGQGATNATWVWCPNVEGGNSVPLSELYPGDAYVDWTCLDGYNMGGSSQSFSSIYSQSYSDLLKLAPTKPMMIGEVASLEYGAGTKATWISNMLSELPTSFPQIKAMVWFNWRNYHNGTWESNEVESSASSQTAFATGIASPYYAAASSYAMPAALSKIQPPQ
jgi:Glycosyl hydrolase family 26/Fibronectin type III domain